MKLVFLDLDQTIIDKQYEFNVDVALATQKIAEIQNRGVTIGLNSDTPLQTLLRYHQKLGLNGPVIAELGAIVYLPTGQEILANPQATGFDVLRNNFIESLLGNSSFGELFVVVGDVNALATDMTLFPPLSATLAVLVNGLRKASCSYFVREQSEQGWTMSSRASLGVFEIFRSCCEGSCTLSDQLVFSLDHDYGFCCAYHNRSAKCVGVKTAAAHYPGQKLYMVGDSIADYLDESVTHCAVGNARKDYACRCQYQATDSYAKGVLEILDWIALDSEG